VIVSKVETSLWHTLLCWNSTPSFYCVEVFLFLTVFGRPWNPLSPTK